MSKRESLLAIGALLMVSVGAAAQAPTATLEPEPTQQIRMETGQTRLLHTSSKVVRVSVADPNVADVQVVTPQQILVTAKAVGYTHLIVWGANEEPLVMAVSCSRNLDELRAQFKELFPGENIHVSAISDLVVLSGTVSDLRLPARAAEVAALHSERLANLIQVTGDQQVQLDVRFAEVSRGGLRKSGVNFLWRDSQRGHVAGISTSSNPPGQYLRGIPGTGTDAPAPPSVPGPDAGDAFNLFFSTGLSSFPFSAILSILAEEGLAKTLAEPTLVALSGQEAQFHAGGEVPILSGQGLGSVSVDYKKFGVQLKFTPTVLSDRNMSLKLGIEVSELDASAGVVVSGFLVPGFRTRSSDTTVRLRDGQSFAIAGLLSDATRSSVSKVPGLGDLPILGALFRSTAYQRDETELLMVVTAHLVRPLQPDDVPPLPGEDEFNDPNDFELFLFGKLEPDHIEDADKRRREKRLMLAQLAHVQENAPSDGAHSVTEPAAPGSSTSPPVQGGAIRPLPMPSSAPKQATPDGVRPLEGPVGPLGFIRER